MSQTETKDFRNLIKNALLKLDESQAKIKLLEDEKHEPLAIVGMSCRFPGGAVSSEAYWELLAEGREAITEIPSSRWDMAGFYDPDPEAKGQSYARHGGFLDQIDEFEPGFFGIAPREAVSMDPQQRLLLEAAWLALENAAIAPDSLVGTRTGVYGALMWSDYLSLLLARGPAAIDGYMSQGTTYSTASGRLSYLLGLQGPCLTVDTACSSSLVGVHLACQGLRNKECDMALAGGVNLMLMPENYINLCKAKMLAPDGRTKAFDAAANGFVRGEGCGMIVLKRLSDALSQGNRILAQIRGSAVNQDGLTSSLTVPSGPAQQAVIRQALASGRVRAEEISYVEAHGTGTSLGDPIEVGALGAVYCANRNQNNPLMVGTVKTNIGHLEGSAGIAGLIKVVLCLQNQALPASLNFREPNPHIDWERLPIRVPVELSPWPQDQGPRVAAVSSFGFAGTNAHVILQEAADPAPRSAQDNRPYHLLSLSAHSETALKKIADAYQKLLVAEPETAPGDLCFTALKGRARLAHRLSVVASDTAQFAALLKKFAEGDRGPGALCGRTTTTPRVAFLFTGQGAQYAGMGRDLYQSQPAFREAIDRCNQILEPILERSLISVLYPTDENDSPIDQTAYAQPALFAVAYALTRLWATWKVEPHALIGHSVGEYVAAVMAGVFSLEDGLRLIAHRGRLMQALPREGIMEAVFCGEEQVVAALEDHKKDVSIAAINGPNQVVISGRKRAVELVLERLTSTGIRHKGLTVSHAFHSPCMEPMLATFRQIANEITYSRPTKPFVSNLTGRLADESVASASYWVRHVSEPVRFTTGIALLLEQRPKIFLEIGPRPHLLGLCKRFLREDAFNGIPSMRPNQSALLQMLRGLGHLHTLGVPVNFNPLYQNQGDRLLALPTYPFERERFWFKSSPEERLTGVAGKTGPRVVKADELVDHDDLMASVSDLVQRHGYAAGSLGQVTGKPFIFLDSSGKSFCFFNIRGTCLVALAHTGTPASFETLIDELTAFAVSHGLEPHFIEHDLERAELLAQQGMSVTNIGALQSIEDVATFTLKSNKMRRLRYLVDRYSKADACETIEYRLGTDRATDDAILGLAKAWSDKKEPSGAMVKRLQTAMEGRLPDWGNRTFLVGRDNVTEGVIIITPIQGRGYLMDVEFYRIDGLSGCTEFGICDILRKLRDEGQTLFSLGYTFGTKMASWAHEDPAVRSFFDDMHDRDILNGDGNYQYKNKFRPQTSPLFLARPRGRNTEGLATFLLMLSDPNNARNPEADRFYQNVIKPNRVDNQKPQGTPRKKQLHPLLHSQLDLAGDDLIFESTLDTQQLGYLPDHRLDDAVLFPATCFIEMALAAGAVSLGTVRLAELLVTDALPLVEGEQKKLQIVLRPQASDLPFKIFSRHENRWQVKASGFLATDEQAVPTPVNLSDIQTRCDRVINPGDFYQAVGTLGYAYGETFQGIELLHVGESEALGRIVGHVSLQRHDYRFHPALMDACFHLCLALLPEIDPNDGFLFLPMSFSGFSIWQMPEGPIWVHGRQIPVKGLEDDTLHLTVTMYDEAGTAIAQCDDMILKRVDKQAFSGGLYKPDQRLYYLGWQKKPLIPITDVAQVDWLVIVDRGGVGDALIKRLRDRGHVAARADLDASANISQVLADLKESRPLHVVYMACLDVVDEKNQLVNQEHLYLPVLQLVQAMFAAGLDSASRLWLVTRCAQPVEGSKREMCLSQAGLWGMGRSLALEAPDLWGGLIDIETGDPSKGAGQIEGEIRPEIGNHKRCIIVANAGCLGCSVARL